MICATRTGSHWASIRPEASRTSRCESCWASIGSNSPDTDRVSSPMSTCSGRSSSDPASSRDRSSRSTDSLPQPLDLIANLVEEARAGLGIQILVLEQLDEPAQREDRRPQLVRRGRDELLARRLELGELVLHLVERDRELPQLVARVDRDRVPELAGGDLLGRQLEALDALRQRARRPGSCRSARAAARSRRRPGSRGGRSRRCGRCREAAPSRRSPPPPALERDRVRGLGDRARTPSSRCR